MEVTMKAYLLAPLFVFAACPAANAGNWNVPIAAQNILNPVPMNADTLAAGDTIYSKECTSCHGSDGLGNGTEQRVDYSLQSILLIPTQPNGQPLTDGELYWKITHGVGKMPSFAGILTDRERWLMVNHIRNLPMPDGLAKTN